MSKVIKSNRLIIAKPFELRQETVEHITHSETAATIIEETEQTVKKILEKAKEQSAKMVAEATGKAEGIKSQALAEVDTIKQNAFEQGYSQGIQQAKSEIEQERDSLLDNANQILAEAKKKKENYLAEVKEEIVELALEIAAKVIFQQIKTEPDAIVEIANHLIEYARPESQTTIVIEVAPEEEQKLMTALEDRQIFWQRDKVKIIGNKKIGIGNCSIATTKGTYSLTIQEALTKLKEILLGAEISE